MTDTTETLDTHPAPGAPKRGRKLAIALVGILAVLLAAGAATAAAVPQTDYEAWSKRYDDNAPSYTPTRIDLWADEPDILVEGILRPSTLTVHVPAGAEVAVHPEMGAQCVAIPWSNNSPTTTISRWELSCQEGTAGRRITFLVFASFADRRAPIETRHVRIPVYKHQKTTDFVS